jgi:DNA modification methylase
MARAKSVKKLDSEDACALPFMAAHVKNLPLRDIKPYGRNARTHSRRQIKQLQRSIREFGFTVPILIDGDGMILAGHGRLAAAKELGLKEVPTLCLEHLSDAQKRAYILADNRLAQNAGWDRELVGLELQDLVDLDFDIELTGFEIAQADILIAEAKLGSNDGQEIIPPYGSSLPVTRLGDLWTLGGHRLYCGDARNQHSYDQLLGGELAQFVFTDPPYNVPIDGHVCGLGRIRHKDFAMGCGEMSRAAFTKFLTESFVRLVQNTCDGSIHDICMDWRHMSEMLEAGYSTYSELKNVCVWNKTNGGMGSFYRSKHELIFLWKGGSAPHINNFELGQFGRSRTNVWDYPGISSRRPGRDEELLMHPTVKPVELVADAIKDCSKPKGLVLDPFAGSGTTVIASENTGRRARAIEIDPNYVDVVIRRWEARTGKSAQLEKTGETFELVAETRCAEGVCPHEE